MIDIINDIPDIIRMGILPAIRIVAMLCGWTCFEDGSVIP